jgi:drug/metabolite transporter (DMT)-like permease
LIYLLGSVILTSYLTLSFKVLERYRIPVLQAIVVNYWVCVTTGSLVNGHSPFNASLFQQPWLPWACLMGTMFIALFNLIAWVTQKIGVAVSSVANKMSLVVPFLFSLYLYNEKAGILKIIGIVIALVAVLFTCWPNGKLKNEQKSRLSPFLLFVMPAILFFGSGLLDTTIKYVEQNFLNDYLISSFAMAALAGSLLLVYLFLSGKQKPEPKAIVAGILIGIPNYFSIWCLLRVLEENQGNSSAIIPVNNMGIVLFSSLMAYLLFRERLSLINWIGIFLAVGSIALIAFG